MIKILIYIVPVLLMAAPAAAAPSPGGEGESARDLHAAGGGASLVLAQRRGGGVCPLSSIPLPRRQARAGSVYLPRGGA